MASFYPPMLIDDLMPEWDFDERHSIVVNALPNVVFDAIGSFTARETPIFVALMGIRALPTLVARRAISFSRPVLGDMERFGFVRLVQALGPSARALFAAYWLAIRPWSGVIRKSWLRAIKKRAESAVRPVR